MIARFLLVSNTALCKWRSRFKEQGGSTLMLSRPAKKKKWDFSEVKAAVFSILHAPPSAFGFNRISWRLEDMVVVKRAEGVGL